MSNKKVVVEVNQQQGQMLDWLVAEGNFGRDRPAVIRAVLKLFCAAHPELVKVDAITTEPTDHD